jgi:hypothetical protein
MESPLPGGKPMPGPLGQDSLLFEAGNTHIFLEEFILDKRLSII